MGTRSALVALVLAISSAVAPSAAEAHGCAVVWGSLEKGAGAVIDSVDPGPPMFDVRAGRHACYDRLVIDVRGTVADYHVEYVAAVTGLATGDPVALRGGAFLEVIVGAGDHDDDFNVTYPRTGQAELVDVTGYSTFRQVAWAESHENVTAIGLGVRARLPFRVFILPGPGTGSRLVIDVAHRW